jgi:predicted RNA-binding Zn-ribbon protein involved in translation (DUF1610 family)
MQAHSEYHFECPACGAEIVTESKETVCTECGQSIVLEWPAAYAAKGQEAGSDRQ